MLLVSFLIGGITHRSCENPESRNHARSCAAEIHKAAACLVLWQSLNMQLKYDELGLRNETRVSAAA